MGDRRQIKFMPCNLWFYTHWGGSDLGLALKQAISAAQPRWSDSSYCLRIIIRELLQPYDGETGAGLWHTYMDSEHIDFIVDIDNMNVIFGMSGIKWSFEEFIQLTDEQIRSIDERYGD